MDFLSGFIGSRTKLMSRTWGSLTIEAATFSAAADGDLVIEVGMPSPTSELLLRIHSECVFAEVFDSDLCDCADQLEHAMKRLTIAGNGMLIYLRLDGRGAGLAAKVKATALEIEGVDTFLSREKIGVPPEGRDFRSIGTYLRERGFARIRLLTNNPLKVRGLQSAGLEVETEPLLVTEPSAKVRQLYRAKAEKFGHTIPRHIINATSGDLSAPSLPES